MTKQTGRFGGRNGWEIDYRVFNTSAMTAPGVIATKFLGMAKSETAIALNRRTDTRSDFKNHVEHSDMLRQVWRNKFQFDQASRSNNAILIDCDTSEAFDWK